MTISTKAKPAKTAETMATEAATEAATHAATHAATQAATQARDSIEGFVKASQAQAQKHFEQTVAATKEQVEKASAQVMKGYDEVSALAKDNVDALIEAGTIAAKGAEDIGKEVVSFAQASFDKSVAAGKAILSAKTLLEVVDLQNDYAKSSFDALLTGATKIQELAVKATNAAFAPIGARVNAAVDKLSKPIAA